MMMVSFRLQKHKILALALVLGLTVFGGRYALNRFRLQNATPTEKIVTLRGKNPTVKSADQRAAFIASFGWEVEEEPVEMMEVVIPAQFDEVYEKYNYLQKQQGYDLEKFQSKRCKRYSYDVLNYPGGIENVRVNLLIYKNKVVGGDVSSTELGGFMHGFDIATSATWLSVPDSTSPVGNSTTTPVDPAGESTPTSAIIEEPMDAMDPQWDDSAEAAQYQE